VIYAELSVAFSNIEALDRVLDGMQLKIVEIPKPALFLAGKALLRYRRRGGVKNNVLGDFFIGAHAAVSGLPVLTRDPRRYKSYFPGVRLVTPP
jgi:predicted nucleic acid-binding protein